MIMIRLKGFEFGGSSQVKENREKFVSDLINYNNGTATFDKDYIKQDLVNGVTDKEKLEFLNKDKEFSEEYNKLILYWKDRYIEYQNSL